MSAHFYAVTFDPTINTGSRDGVMGAVVAAETVADAKAFLRSLHGDVVDAGWDNATYTQMAAGADLQGWTARVVLTKTNGDIAADVTVTGAAAATVDSIGALLVTALNATTPISNASYTSNVLTVAGAADGLGDAHVFAAFMPPNSNVAVPGFVGAIVDEGSAGDAVTVAFAADAYTVPSLTAKFKDTSPD